MHTRPRSQEEEIQKAIEEVLDAHFPRCGGTDVFQGEGKKKGRCGCRGTQHSFLLPELSALLYTFRPDVHRKVFDSVGCQEYKKLSQFVASIDGQDLKLKQRTVNGQPGIRNAIFGVRRTSLLLASSLSHSLSHACSAREGHHHR